MPVLPKRSRNFYELGIGNWELGIGNWNKNSVNHIATDSRSPTSSALSHDGRNRVSGIFCPESEMLARNPVSQPPSDHVSFFEIPDFLYRFVEPITFFN
ncbi:MAG: hypothetical protein F6K47_34140 [Symploca sp. SIO2E6]|nr:hypothetical protein [Symploca sp. SIO2E6]